MTPTTRSRSSGANSQQERNENVTKTKILKKLKTENMLKTEKKPKSKNRQKNKAPKTGKRIESESSSKTTATQDFGRKKVRMENSMVATPTESKAYNSSIEQIIKDIREEYGYISSSLVTKIRSQDKYSDIFECSINPKENSALREYRQRALLCSKDEKVIEMESILEGKTPFVFMNASSGHGKTQMAFNLQAKGLQVLYIVCSNSGDNSQDIYKAFADRQGVFENCLKADMKTMTYFDAERMKKGLKEGFVYGFIGALLLNKDKVERQLERDELLEILKKQKRKPVVFLDEFPQYVDSRSNEEGNQNYLRFMRNVFISMDVKVIISSTCSSSMNMISCGSHSRSEQCDLWCTVFPRLPKYHGAHPTVNSFSAVISNCRPLFAHLAVEYINSNPSASLDKLCAHLLIEIKGKKGNQPQFYDGQVLLFLSASFVEDDSPLINGHFADLVNNENFDIYLKDSFLCTKHESAFKPWKPVSSFRPFKQDVLMYLSLMGGNGNWAVCVASHIQGLRGTTVRVFLKDLLYQLKGIHVSNVKFPPLFKCFENLQIPYLSPPCEYFPDWFKDYAISNDLNVADLSRSANKDRIDLKTVDSILSGECKDYRNPISLKTMKNILIRVPVDKERKGIHLVVSNAIQRLNFSATEEKSDKYQDFVKIHNHLEKVVIYEISDEGTLQPIKGLTNKCQNPQTIVIFCNWKKINKKL